METVYAQPEKNAISLAHASKIHSVMEKLVLSNHPKSVLEVGCGAGVLGARIASAGIRYVGLDPDEVSLNEARKKFPHLDVHKGSSIDPPGELNLGQFDLVCSNDVIEHVYQPRLYLEFVRQHLREGGIFICGTPDYGSYTRNLVLSVLNRWDKHHNPLWDGGHIKFFSKHTLGKLLEECGFRVREWKTIGSSRVPILSSALFCIAQREG